jgi:hypothetical protein
MSVTETESVVLQITHDGVLTDYSRCTPSQALQAMQRTPGRYTPSHWISGAQLSEQQLAAMIAEPGRYDTKEPAADVVVRDVPTLPRHLALLMNALASEAFDFEPEHVGGDVWVLVQHNGDDSAYVISDDTVAHYAPNDWQRSEHPSRAMYLTGNGFADVLDTLNRLITVTSERN